VDKLIDPLKPLIRDSNGWWDDDRKAVGNKD